MRVVVERDRCDGQGVCAERVPEVFRVGDDDIVVVDEGAAATVPRERLQEAVTWCPKRALKLRD